MKWLRLFFVLLALNSCASSLSEMATRIPPADPSLPIRVKGVEAAAALDHLIGDQKQSGADKHTAFPIEDMLRVEQKITNRPLVAGNRVQLLIDGPQTFEAMFAAMRAARHHIHIETFIIDDEKIGSELADILIERRQAGVEVRMIYDAIGALPAKQEFFDRLEQQGVILHEYHPLEPTDVIRIWRLNNRHHRKISIIDGQVGFTGGLNISGVYSSSSSEAIKNIDDGWRDTHVKVEGPVVAQLQEIFVLLWARLHESPPLDGPDYFPPLSAKGHQLVRLVDSIASDPEVEIYQLNLAVIEHARERIWITQGYFSPDSKILDALKNAARRNVDVRLLLPGLTDSWITISSSRAHYSELMSAGVRIFERRDALQHAKTAVVDSIWSMVGSANLDYRSFLHSNEANLVIWGKDFAQEMETIFLADQEQNIEINLQEWRKRPLRRKILEFFASFFDYWL